LFHCVELLLRLHRSLVVNLLDRSSLYRQWRPRRFDEVVGQEHVVTTLQNAVRRDQVSHAYIFAGPRGTGKTTVARLLAKIVNCEESDNDVQVNEPCNECESCVAIDSSSSMNMVEVDAASHRGIDDIRELQERVPYATTSGRYRVYILDEAHMLTTEAFNALLKTLEEPPEHVIFILATTEPHKIPVTVQSRCQRFDFRYLTVEEIAQRLSQVAEADENLNLTEPATWAISLYSEGAVRDALGLLEQCRDYATGEITDKDVRTVTGAVSREILIDYCARLHEGDITGLMDLIDEVSMAGADMAQFIRDLLSLSRDMLLFQASDGARRPVMPEHALEKMKKTAGQFRLPQLLTLVDYLANAEDRSRYSTQPRFLLEMCSIRLAGEFTQAGAAGPQEMTKTDAQQFSAGEEQEKTTAQPSESDFSADTEDAGVSHGVGQISGEKSQPETYSGQTSQDLNELWEKLKEGIRKSSLPTHALVQPARPGKISNNKFYLVFGDQYEFHRDRTQEQARELLEKLLEKLTGEKLGLKCVLESEFSEAGSGSSRESAVKEESNSAAESGSDISNEDDVFTAEERNGEHGSDANTHDLSNQEQNGDGYSDEEDPSFEHENSKTENTENEDQVDGFTQEIVDMFSGRVVGKLSEMNIPGETEKDEKERPEGERFK